MWRWRIRWGSPMIIEYEIEEPQVEPGEIETVLARCPLQAAEYYAQAMDGDTPNNLLILSMPNYVRNLLVKDVETGQVFRVKVSCKLERVYRSQEDK